MDIEQHSHLSRTNLPPMNHFLHDSRQEALFRQLELEHPASSSALLHWPSRDSSSHPAAPPTPSSERSFVTQRYDDVGKRPSTASLSLNLSSLSVDSSSLPSPLGVMHQDQTQSDNTSMQPRFQPVPHQFAYNPPLPTGASPSNVEWNGLASSTRSNSSELYYGTSDATVVNTSPEERTSAYNPSVSHDEDSTASKAPFGMQPSSRRTSLPHSISSSQMHDLCRDLPHDSLSNLAQNSILHVDLPAPGSSHLVTSPLERNVPYPPCEGTDFLPPPPPPALPFLPPFHPPLKSLPT